MKKAFFMLAFFLLFFPAVFAVIEKGTMPIYAVTTQGEGLVATLTLEIEPGEGKIWSAVTPLVGTTTQNAERTAIQIASGFFPRAGAYDYKFSISSVASVVEGPSAGAAMTLLASSMLTDKAVPETVSITGTINEDGSIGPVGGVFEKVKEASETGVEFFMIPSGEAIQTVKLDEGVKSVNLLDYAPREWGIKVVEVETIEDAMHYAFSDFEALDINTSSSEAIPEFIPQKIDLPEHLGSFKILTTNYINETRNFTEEARSALSSSLLEDSEVTGFLLDVLNDAEQTLSRAEILNEQNYLYSAANFAFLARVNAILVKEISSNPSLLEEGSTAFDLKLMSLKQELLTFENDLSENVPREGIEWFASAQQRYSYAKLTLDSLVSSQTISIEADEEEKLLVVLERLQDYAFAVAWLDVSKDFYNLSLESSGFVSPLGDFESSADPLLVSAEDGILSIEEDSREDIQRRIDSAKREKEYSWFEASLFDAASAKSFVSAEMDSREKTDGELRQMLAKKISFLESSVNDSNVNLGWAVLYLDHAKYFLASADYYAERNLALSAGSDLKSGLALAYLAEEIFGASSSVLKAYSAAQIVEGANGKAQDTNADALPGLSGSELILLAILLLLLCSALFLAIVLMGMMSSAKNRHFSIIKEIYRTEKKLRELEFRLQDEKVTTAEYNDLKRKYSEKLSFLEAEREERARHVLEVDNCTAEIKSYALKIAELRKHFKERIITKREYEERFLNYSADIEALRRKLETEMENLKVQKKFLENLDMDAIKQKPYLPVPGGRQNPVIAKPAESAVKPAPKPKSVPKAASPKPLAKPKEGAQKTVSSKKKPSSQAKKPASNAKKPAKTA